MSIGLIVERNGGAISLDEWKEVVARHSNLRIRQEPYVARNPSTGDTIQMPAGPGDAELKIGEQWTPLLRFNRGKLKTKYSTEHDDPNNIERQKIAQLARELGAVIMTDVGDEPLSW